MVPQDVEDALRVIVTHLRGRLVGSGFADHVDLLDLLRGADVVLPRNRAGDLPVLGSLDAALNAARACSHAQIADAVAVLGSAVPWTRTASYVLDPPDAMFLDGYAHATLLGTPDGSGATTSGDVSLGLLLLDARFHYPPHHHPADEVYLPLTAARWTHELDQDYRDEAPGVLIHHTPWQPHGMRTGDRPLLAVYLWSGDVGTPSAFCQDDGPRLSMAE